MSILKREWIHFPLVRLVYGPCIHVLPLELVTIICINVEEYNPYKKIHPRRRLKVKVISQNKGKGGMIRRDRGSNMRTRYSAIIFIRVDIRSISVGHFIHTYV
jgi:hypothetical protein